ncbi:gliding motility-associated C-terminal domain-containing protein [Myroides sp. LJL116]
MINYKTLLLLAGICSYGAVAQSVQKPNEVTSNKGQLYVSPNGVLSTKYNFVNQPGADFRNNGEFHVFKDVENNGDFFDYKGDTPQGTTYFKGNTLQNIKGNAITLNHVEFNNTTDKEAFKILSDIDIHGETQFADGIVRVEEANGSLTFLHGSSIKHVHDGGHVLGRVDKLGTTSFTYPFGGEMPQATRTGDVSIHRPAMIAHETKGDTKDAFGGHYGFLDAPEIFASRSEKEGVVLEVDTKEYWLIENSEKNKADIVLSLTWDERTTPTQFIGTKANEMKLAVLRWNPAVKMWINEGGIVDLDNKTVTTPTEVKGYGYFTLGLVDSDHILDGGVVIYNLVSTNDGTHNDYFRIENIERYPNNSVEIFNRWGAKVYQTTNYNSNGNVFRGYSDGKVTLDKGSKLPSGTYYYVINYEYTSDSGSKNIKKAGYLQLDNN